MAQINMVEFKGLYQQTYVRVRRVVFKHGFRDSQAEDIIQESFATAWEKRASLKKIESFGAWIRTIARNHCILAMRSHARVASIAPSDHGDEKTRESEWCEDLLSDDCVAGECWLSKLEREHTLLLLAEIVRDYKVEPRATIGRMHYLEEASVKNISQMLSIKQNTVLSHLRRFRHDLSQIMLARIERQVLCVS